MSDVSMVAIMQTIDDSNASREEIKLVDSQLDFIANQLSCLWDSLRRNRAADVDEVVRDIEELTAMQDPLEARLDVMLKSPAGVLLSAEWDAGWAKAAQSQGQPIMFGGFQ